MIIMMSICICITIIIITGAELSFGQYWPTNHDDDCGLEGVDLPIKDAVIEDVPWLADLHYKDGKSDFSCSGTLIDADHVQTNFPCIRHEFWRDMYKVSPTDPFHYQPHEIKVRLAFYKELIPVKEICHFPFKYHGFFIRRDYTHFALLKLDIFSVRSPRRKPQPVCIPREGTKDDEFDRCNFYAWQEDFRSIYPEAKAKRRKSTRKKGEPSTKPYRPRTFPKPKRLDPVTPYKELTNKTEVTQGINYIRPFEYREPIEGAGMRYIRKCGDEKDLLCWYKLEHEEVPTIWRCTRDLGTSIVCRDKLTQKWVAMGMIGQQVSCHEYTNSGRLFGIMMDGRDRDFWSLYRSCDWEFPLNWALDYPTYKWIWPADIERRNPSTDRDNGLNDNQ